MLMVTHGGGGVNWDALPVIEETGEILEDFNPKTQKKTDWRKKKVTSVEFAELLEEARRIDETVITEKRLSVVKECASFLMFAQDKEQNKKLYQANFCHHRLCPMCAWRRSLLLFAQTSQVVDAIAKDLPTTRYIFVTFTVRNCPATADDLIATLDMMNAAFLKLVGTGRNGAAIAKVFRKNLLGYMRAIEVTFNQKTKTYHPHMHVIFAVKSTYFRDKSNYLNKEDWQFLWTELLGVDYEAIVMPKKIDTKKQSGAVAEVAKYPTKPADLLKIKNRKLAARALVGLAKAMKGRRLTTFGGIFKEYRAKLKLQDVESENVDLVNAGESEITPVEMVLYRWNARVGAYIC